MTSDVPATEAGSPSPPAPVGRTDRDIYRLAPSMDAGVLDTIAARLEFRGTDDGYAQLSQAYFRLLPLDDTHRILALGCGTGIEVRALRRLSRPETAIVGLDHSSKLIETAERLTADEDSTTTSPIASATPISWGTTTAPSTSSPCTR